MYFAWKDEYSVNIAVIDNQHKKLFEIGRKVSDLIFSNDKTNINAEVLTIFNELKNYTTFHFRFEEKLLKKLGYSHFETHKNEHDMLVEKVHLLESRSSEALQKETLIQLINFIFDWISNHILKGDMKYKDFLIKALNNNN